MSLTPRSGDVLGGKYILHDRIGEGGMGMVFLAEQPALGRHVAIKILRPALRTNRRLVGRFRDEALAASRVHHPGAVVVLDCNLIDGTPYIVMEHIRGRPLGRLIAEQPFPVRRATDVVLQILNALDATHAAGVVHGDVKSDNFLVEEIDGRDHLTLIDFGLAHLDGTVETAADIPDGMISGTPEYMAPEVIRGEGSRVASDLYGAGVILYELLTGATPFGGGPARDIMTRHLDDLVVPPSLRRPERGIPPVLDDIVVRALEKEPAARFSDAAEFAAALRDAAVRSRAFVREIPRRDDHARPDSPTRTCGPRASRQPLARGSDRISATGNVPELRRAIALALGRGDVRQIADGYARLAAELTRNNYFAAAVAELEEGIDVVTHGTGVAPEVVDQLVVALAALYDEAGQRELARELAANADRHPTSRAAK